MPGGHKPIRFSRSLFGRKGVMVLGAISFDEKLQLVFSTARMKSEDSQMIIEDVVLPPVHAHIEETPIFQQDNASIDTSQLMSKVFKILESINWSVQANSQT